MALIDVEHDVWRSSVNCGHADELLRGLDPSWPFVLIETWDGVPGWHDVPVSVAGGEQRSRTVRRHSFDVLVTPTEAIEIGTQLRREGVAGGGLACCQFVAKPRADFRLPDDPKRRAHAMRGLGLKLKIDLPHDGEVALIWSTDKAALEAFLARLH